MLCTAIKLTTSSTASTKGFADNFKRSKCWKPLNERMRRQSKSPNAQGCLLGCLPSSQTVLIVEVSSGCNEPNLLKKQKSLKSDMTLGQCLNVWQVMRCLGSLQNARARFWIRFVIAFSQVSASSCWDPANGGMGLSRGSVKHASLWTSTFDNHLNYCLVVKDIQHSAGVRMRCISWSVINVCWNVVGVLDWDGVVHVWLDNCRRVSPWLSLSQSISSVRYGMKYFNHQIPQRAGILSMREMISASVELCETEVCFLHIQLIGTNVCLPKMHRILLDVDFESSRSPAESESWNNPSLHCCAVFPTWPHYRYSFVWWM